MKYLNLWNIIRYTIYTPFYNFLLQGFDEIRKKSLAMLKYNLNDKILLIGCGTGRDLQYLPIGPTYYLTDITPSMLAKAELLAKKIGHNYKASVCSGDKLPFRSEKFDKVILSLIIAIIPNPLGCLIEVRRVLKPEGRILIFDKLAKPAEPFLVKTFKIFINIFTSFFFSSITRVIEPLAEQSSLKIIQDTPLLLGEIFRAIVLTKRI